MALDDLRLEHTPAPRRPSARSSTSRWVILGAGVVVAGSLLALWWLSRAQPPPATLAPTSATEAARPPMRPQRQPMELPALSASDAMLREVVATLSRHPLLARLVAQPDVVRAITLAVLQVGDGRTPAVPLAPLRPDDRLAIAGGATGRIDPSSYARWNQAVSALRSIRAADAAQVYVNVKPLFDEAYRELGYPDGDFDEAIVRGIRMLAATPELAADPVLVRRPGYLEYDDPTLRSLPPVQKQLLLTGGDNREQIIAWLREFARALDLQID